MSERTHLPPIAWFLILIVVFSGVMSTVYSIYEGFSNPEAWKDLAILLIQSCFIASIVCYFNSGRGKDGEVPSEIRDRVTERSTQARRKGIPWYIAPVVWVPISMLSVIWYFGF